MYEKPGLTHKIYGPYLHKNGRNYIVIKYSDRTSSSRSYARFLMEQHLGRLLTKEETVDHIDNDKTNDDISNLTVMSLEENVRKAWKEGIYDALKIDSLEIICPICDGTFHRKPWNVRYAKKRNPESIILCSNKCRGLYTTMFVNKGIKLPKQDFSEILF